MHGNDRASFIQQEQNKLDLHIFTHFIYYNQSACQSVLYRLSIMIPDKLNNDHFDI